MPRYTPSTVFCDDAKLEVIWRSYADCRVEDRPGGVLEIAGVSFHIDDETQVLQLAMELTGLYARLLSEARERAEVAPWQVADALAGR